MRKHRLLIPIAGMALILAACATDDEGSPATSDAMSEAPSEAMSMEASSSEEMSADASASDGQAAATLLDEIMGEPELYEEGNTVTAIGEVAEPIDGANAWIMEAGGQDVLLVGPEDSEGDQEFAAGDLVLFTGSFMGYDVANIGDIPGVVDEGAIADSFNGEHVIAADSIEPAR